MQRFSIFYTYVTKTQEHMKWKMQIAFFSFQMAYAKKHLLQSLHLAW